MGGFASIIQGIVLDKLLRGDAPFVPKIKIGLGLTALSGFFILIGLCLLIYASHLWFQTQFPPEIAFALTGSLIIGLGLGFGLATYLIAQHEKKLFRKLKKEIEEVAESLFELLDEELKEPISENPKAAIMLASLGGYMAGKKLL